MVSAGSAVFCVPVCLSLVSSVLLVFRGRVLASASVLGLDPGPFVHVLGG